MSEARLYSFETRPGRTWYYHIDAPPGHGAKEQMKLVAETGYTPGKLTGKLKVNAKLRAVNHRQTKKLRGAIHVLLKGKKLADIAASQNGGDSGDIPCKVDMEMVSLSSDLSEEDAINIPMFAPIMKDNPPPPKFELDGEGVRLQLQRRKERRRSSFAHQMKLHHMDEISRLTQGTVDDPMDVAQNAVAITGHMVQEATELGATGLREVAGLGAAVIEPLRRSRRRLRFGRAKLKTILSISGGSHRKMTNEWFYCMVLLLFYSSYRPIFAKCD